MTIIPLCCAFVLNERNDILCVKQKFDVPDGYFWSLPGGGIDDGETPEQAAQREVKEETGLDVSGAERVYECTVLDNGVTLHVHGILFRGADGVMHSAEAEITEIAFLPPDHAKKEIAAINDASRIEPICRVLESLEKEETPFFHCRYTLDANRAIIACDE